MTDVPAEEVVDQVEISCQACGATLLLDSNLRTTVCPYCASPSVIERPPSANRPAPSFVVGFVVDHERAASAVRDWINSSSIFARSDFKQAAPELTRGVYLPAYLYGAVADSNYSARIGENYTEIETYTTTDSKGNTVTRTRTVTKTEYRSLSGQHSTYIVDVVVTASAGVTNDALEAIEPFDLRALRRYDPSFISGWLAEDPSRSKDDCFQLSHDESVEKVGHMLHDFMPGESHRDLQFESHLSQEVIDLVLLPVWSFAVRYAENQPPVQILVNGQTGRVGGKVPISAIKVTVAVLLGVAVVGGFILMIASQN
jgi:DNA-directed RNA polymerase subunit RPC12/RpoP